MRIVSLLVNLLLLAMSLSAQVQDSSQMEEILVTDYRLAQELRVLPARTYSLQKLDQAAPLNLSDALARIPGFSQITTGNAIAKPVLRGLYGDRLLILLSGLRFDNQQWQDEHGLGLSQIGIDGVYILRGSASLRYGSGALGGVIDIREETPKRPGTTLNLNTRGYSNTLGTLTDVGLLHQGKRNWYRIRVGMESHADYADGRQARVANSRNAGYYLKAGFGFQRRQWTQHIAYNFSYNQFGFILPDPQQTPRADPRWSRQFTGPHHNVALHTLSAQNTWNLRASTLQVNVGMQHNSRAEDEGGGEISLNMRLLSWLQNAQWVRKLHESITLTLTQQASFQTNTNLGKRSLIPDARVAEQNAAALASFKLGKTLVEAGVGLNARQIKTHKTNRLNDGRPTNPDPDIAPFVKNAFAGNLLLGLSYQPTRHWNLKLNTATGNRMPNLAEQSANGLHEGVYRYEIGDPALRMEHNWSSEAALEYEQSKIAISLNAYYYQFSNYIYLAPTNTQYQGFYDLYRFRQANATLYGGEASGVCSLHPRIQWTTTIAYTQGLLAHTPQGGSRYLPFISPPRARSSVRFQKLHLGPFRDLFFEPELVYVWPQQQIALFERPTPDYALLHLHTGATIICNKHPYILTCSVFNVANKVYADYLSRLKNYGINNTGLNIVVAVKTDIHR